MLWHQDIFLDLSCVFLCLIIFACISLVSEIVFVVRASVPVCVCVKLGSPESLESVGKYVGGPPSHQATKPSSQRAATLVGRAPATLPPSQLAQLPTTATSPPCPTLSRLECATTQRAPRDVCLTTNKGFRLGAQVRETCLSRCLPTKVGGPLRCPLPAFTKNPNWQDRGTNPNNNLHRTSCFYHAVYRFWQTLAGSKVFPAFTSIQASTTPTYKAYTRYGEDRRVCVSPSSSWFCALGPTSCFFHSSAPTAPTRLM